MPSRPRIITGTDKAEVIHFRDKDFLEQGFHWPPGWYFYDDEGELYGPFVSEAQTQVALQIYIGQLLRGEAPTQLPELLGGPKLSTEPSTEPSTPSEEEPI